MADSKINDYLVEYYFPVSSGPAPSEAHHFSLDGIFKLVEDGAIVVRIDSIKNPPYKPIDVTAKTMALIERMK